MEIALHLGVHQTDQDHLLRCLMRNRAALLEQGIAVPGPGRYRRQLRQIALEMREQETSAATQEALLDGILDTDEAERLILSSPDFLAMPRWAIGQGRLYPAAGERLAMLRRLFPAAQVEVFVALRNPATLLPALVAADRSGKLAAQLATTDPTQLRWSAMLARMRESVPGVPITVWACEDLPQLWPEVLRAVSDHLPGRPLDGWLGWYWSRVTPKGHEAMRRWFENNPPADEASRRRVLEAFMTRFARRDAVSPDPPLPGWSGETIDTLTRLYDEDLDLIAAMPGLRLLEA